MDDHKLVLSICPHLLNPLHGCIVLHIAIIDFVIVQKQNENPKFAIMRYHIFNS